MRHSSIFRSIVAALALAPGLASALTDDEINSGIQFNFSNPGARSLGLGGAFTGLADDATAVYANPAGLTILRSQEFGSEVRHTAFDTPYTTGGNVRNNAFDPGDAGRDIASDSLTQVSFASWVKPLESATLALYYHRIGDFKSEFVTDPTEFLDANGNGTDQVLAKVAEFEYQVDTLGVGVGYRVSDRFSVGLTVAYSDFSIDSSTLRFFDDEPLNFQRQRGDDQDFAYTVGALWQISPQWNLGLAYRAGADFEYDASNEVIGTTLRLDRETGFDLPNVFSVGLAYRPSDNWLFTLDANRVEYSRISDGLVTLFSLTGPPQALAIEDGTEIRLGGEYAFLDMDTPLFLRAGVWRDPDHRLSYQDAVPTTCTPDNVQRCFAAVIYPEGEDEMHYSVGLGWAFQKFQLDFAADFSDLVDTYAASGVVRF
ncbi:MAG: outer membrane protein transport protein [Xanthomonadales bacterium]|nr:hypothetical protein [Xanthomonadales bacterium]MCC6592753.1 outer membrane protein transport protein [Xanthomonadales bacterium]